MAATPGLGALLSPNPGAVSLLSAGYNPNSAAAKNPAVDVTAPAAAAPTTPAASGITTTGGASTTDPNAVAYYSDVVNQLMDELKSAQGEKSTGIANINNAFNQQKSELNQQQSTALSGYNTQTAENGQQREQNLGTIDQGANAALSSLLGILGAGGAGVSSVASVTAPQAVAQNASQQREGTDTTYNTNSAAIDTDESNTKEQYKDALTDLLTSKNSSTESYLSGVLGDEANLEQQIGAAKVNAAEYGGKSYTQAEAGAGNENKAVGSIEDQLNSLFKQYATPSFSVSPVTATTPNLASYNYDPTTVAAAASNPSADSSFAPYLPNTATPTSGITTGGMTNNNPVPLTVGAS